MNKIVNIEQGDPDITDKIKNMVLKQVNLILGVSE